jgi:hypothetical protein
MSPAQWQLTLALVERAAGQAFDAYIDSCTRSSEAFEEMSRINKLRDELRAEAKSVDEASVASVVSVPPSNGEVA